MQEILNLGVNYGLGKLLIHEMIKKKKVERVLQAIDFDLIKKDEFIKETMTNDNSLFVMLMAALVTCSSVNEDGAIRKSKEDEFKNLMVAMANAAEAVFEKCDDLPDGLCGIEVPNLK